MRHMGQCSIAPGVSTRCSKLSLYSKCLLQQLIYEYYTAFTLEVVHFFSFFLSLISSVIVGLECHVAPDLALGHATVGRTPLDERSVRCRDPYLTTANTVNRQTSMLPAEFEPAVPTHERPQTHCRQSGHWDRHFAFYGEYCVTKNSLELPVIHSARNQ